MQPGSVEFLESVLDAQQGVLYVYDLALRRSVYVNNRWVEDFGYTIARPMPKGTFWRP